jgi:hypothetical protein
MTINDNSVPVERLGPGKGKETQMQRGRKDWKLRPALLRGVGVIGVSAMLVMSAAAAAISASAHGNGSHRGGPAAGDTPGGAPPHVEDISARTGPTSGGTEVTITGDHFGASCSSLSFSEITCPNIIVYFGTEPGFVFAGSASTIQAISPPHAAGRVPVSVVTPTGNSASQGEDQQGEFTYTGSAPVHTPGEAPVVKALEPNHGPAAGFEQVRIKGEHLTPEGKFCVQCSGENVHFGTTSVVVAQGTQHELLVVAPPHTPGMVDVTVTTNPGGTSATSAADEYTYE